MIILRLWDKTTASKIRNGDVQAFENLINEYKTKIFGYCLHTLNNYHMAEEVTQEVFVKVYKNINTYDSTQSSLSTWIFTITHNTCINCFRNSRTGIPLQEADYISGPSLEDKVIVDDLLSRLFKILHSLPERDREMIIMKDYLGLKNSEIARILDIPEGTVKSGLHNIRTKIRKKLGDKYD